MMHTGKKKKTSHTLRRIDSPPFPSPPIARPPLSQGRPVWDVSEMYAQQRSSKNRYFRKQQWRTQTMILSSVVKYPAYSYRSFQERRDPYYSQYSSQYIHKRRIRFQSDLYNAVRSFLYIISPILHALPIQLQYAGTYVSGTAVVTVV